MIRPPSPAEVKVWLDPSCPWAWQTFRWLRDLEDRGRVRLTYGLFSLEVNATERPTSFAEAAQRYGDAHAALSLARAEGGDAAFARLYAALGRLLHEDRRTIDTALLREALDDAALAHLADGATAVAHDEDRLREHRSAREADVFGVPTLQLEGGKATYGPILAVGPTGEDADALWQHVEGLLRRDGFFELKRWPRDLRPSGAPTGS
jgi:predicted DsbA family dithiol-disulfide isomerase